ncbi:MAG: hypothetical protein A3D31_13770 [Candidatus Fluviicola riflensis]|nr:MAG: hypothetical protein CHH17_18205 [Candidatus Fluviicola riflensis]OGS78045.1 MAG: hypothetical protein A3D31_13770 [Candidatus Fluviicola riflensis]OGS85110.1 MAG: hypothetical protein A2724_10705 [Fluviicola sp. RIFCSPHIGHO2_01_FULL_43_53]OGS89382.1 MAG: hypothetical protein A3E30_05010 [Fluviicola sp. RIFCSPHIGHO2_12_FULL_43_24]
MKSILLFLLLLVSQNLIAQPSDEELTEICNKVEQVIGEDWFVHQTKSGFEVYFCRSCNENYQKALQEGQLLGWENHNTPISQKDRYKFFKLELADSVSYYSLVSNIARPFDDPLRDEHLKEYYQKNGVVKFTFKFERKWGVQKVNDTQANNELLKAEILSTPLYKTGMGIFSDYRFWLPESYLRQRTEERYDFYFEQLPYTSCWYDYSIFFEQDKPFFFSEVMFVNPSEEKYYDNHANFIEDERCRTLKIIALTLGINDFTLIN